MDAKDNGSTGGSGGPGGAFVERGPGGPGGRSTRALSLARIVDLKGLRALDLGSHCGHNAFDLADCGCDEVVGVELRNRFLAEAEQQRTALARDNVRFVRGDARRVDELGLGCFDVCLCSGLLYHMQNPFNLLKRIRNCCRFLALETHIAPSLLRMQWVEAKYKQHLSLRAHRAVLDGRTFWGRLNVFPAQTHMDGGTSGSVDSHCTFWLFRRSLLRALRCAGFRTRAVYFGRTPRGFPDVLVHHGNFRAKVFIVADVRDPDHLIPVPPGSIRGNRRLASDRAPES